MRKSFSKEELNAAFRRIGCSLETPVEAYLIGGGAMCFRNQKAGTKDLDLIFRSVQDFRSFASAIEKIGFFEAKQVETEYKDLMAAGIWKNSEDFRIDMFVNTVCRALHLSDGMVKRAQPLADYGKLAVKLASNEDIILFKGITERQDDANDIAAIISQADVGWDVVLDECKAQSMEHKWYGLLYNKFAEIEEKHKISAPIMKDLLELDRKSILEEAYARMLSHGMKKENAIAELRKRGFTKKELAHLIS
ncbi:hypothetical protein AUJ17_00840 [Candidatus Micrarchaeota archaeon CG1_02_47_40]|nr:MAG: hypothetical protein AUJ17_00840 [Candidatus Micrarchaeota archaeon CG1_02_47_40]